MSTRIYLLNCFPFGDASLFRKGYRRIDDFRQKRIDRYAKDEDKRLGLGAGLLIRYLRKEEGIEDELRYNEYGKAYFPHSRTRFNLSHAGDYAVLATSEEEVGVDIERIRPVEEGIEAKVFTDAERRLLDEREGEERRKLFFKLWTAKESFLKQLGVGLSRPLNSIDFANAALGDRFEHVHQGETLHFHWIEPKPGYVLCVCSPLEEAPEWQEIALKEAVDTSFLVGGEKYDLEDYLGKGSDGYSFLVRNGDRYSVLKCLHDEPGEYDSFAEKFRSEQASYATLMGLGIRMPTLYELDERKGRIRKEYIPGPTVAEEIAMGHDVSAAASALRAYLPSLYRAKLNLDYGPNNYVYRDGELYYLDYECADFDPAHSFEAIGEGRWS